MTISETELRDILKIQRQLVRVIENALKSEQEKNEERLKKQLESSGVFIDDTKDMACTCKDGFPFHDDDCPSRTPESTDAFEL